jgi:hypothetical protein
MIMENCNCETVKQRQAANVKQVAPGGVVLEAREFERLLRRAMEVLSTRERNAFAERSRLTKAADAAVAITS